MTSLNAEKYLRGLPAREDREAPARLSALLSELKLSDMPRRIFRVTCAGLYARHTAGMLIAAFEAAGIPAVGLFFDEPCAAGYEGKVLSGGKNIAPAMLASAVSGIRSAATAGGFGDSVGRCEALTALAFSVCMQTEARVLVTDASPLSDGECRTLLPAGCVILGTLSGDPEALLRTLISRETAETVSAPQTPAAHGLITDCCAAAGCRLTVSARQGLPGGPAIDSLSFAGVAFTYHDMPVRTSSLFVSSLACACAVIDGARAVSRSGIAVGDAAATEGIRTAPPALHGSVISIRPAVIAAALPEDPTAREADMPLLAADIASAAAAIGVGSIGVFSLFGDTLPDAFVTALAERGVAVGSVDGVRDGEKPKDAVRRAARGMMITDDEIDRGDTEGNVRSFIVIGSRRALGEALPLLRRGITRTMF